MFVAGVVYSEMALYLDLIAASVSMPSVMIIVPLGIRRIIGESRDGDTERAVKTILRNVSLSVPLVSLYTNYIRTHSMLIWTIPGFFVFSRQFLLICFIMDTWFSNGQVVFMTNVVKTNYAAYTIPSPPLLIAALDASAL